MKTISSSASTLLEGSIYQNLLYYNKQTIYIDLLIHYLIYIDLIAETVQHGASNHKVKGLTPRKNKNWLMINGYLAMQVSLDKSICQIHVR